MDWAFTSMYTACTLIAFIIGGSYFIGIILYGTKDLGWKPRPKPHSEITNFVNSLTRLELIKNLEVHYKKLNVWFDLSLKPSDELRKRLHKILTDKASEEFWDMLFSFFNRDDGYYYYYYRRHYRRHYRGYRHYTRRHH